MNFEGSQFFSFIRHISSIPSLKKDDSLFTTFNPRVFRYSRGEGVGVSAVSSITFDKPLIIRCIGSGVGFFFDANFLSLSEELKGSATAS